MLPPSYVSSKYWNFTTVIQHELRSLSIAFCVNGQYLMHVEMSCQITVLPWVHTHSVTSTTKLFFHMVLVTLVFEAICDPLAELCGMLVA